LRHNTEGVLIVVQAGALASVTFDASARTFTIHFKADVLASRFRFTVYGAHVYEHKFAAPPASTSIDSYA
jgi:hypothetical protein